MKRQENELSMDWRLTVLSPGRTQTIPTWFLNPVAPQDIRNSTDDSASISTAAIFAVKRKIVKKMLRNAPLENLPEFVGTAALPHGMPSGDPL